VLIGGGGEQKTLRYTARHADIWHGFGDPATLTHKAEVLAGWCAQEGRDPDDIELSAASDSGPDDAGQDLLDAGISLITIGMSGPAYDMGRVRDWVAWRDEENATRGTGR
jgi:alkanesulfonate monooxygenase SsuD/methylene tetrahydromethanopterin reductase-like flavin-dependent oxidoreductase (luciferase family)